MPLILKKKLFLFNFWIAVCFALQRLETQINDVLQSDCRFYTESGKIDTRETLKDRGTRIISCVSITACKFGRTRKNC